MVDLWVDCVLLVGSVCLERVIVFVKEKKKKYGGREMLIKKFRGFIYILKFLFVIVDLVGFIKDLKIEFYFFYIFMENGEKKKVYLIGKILKIFRI